MFTEQQAHKLLHILFWALVIGGGTYLLFRVLLPLLLPFVLAWLFAWAVQPLILPLHRRTRLPRKLLAILLETVFLSLLFGLAFLLGSRLLYEARTFLSALSADESGLSDTLAALLLRLRERIPFLAWLPTPDPDAITDYLASLLRELSLGLSTLLPKGITFLTHTLPRAIFFLIVLLLSSFYLSAEFQECNRMLISKLPKRAQAVLCDLKKQVRAYGLCYLRAYSLLLLLTFAELSLGFLILGVRYAFTLALVISLLDFLPVLGVGTVLLPWSAGLLLLGDYRSALGLVILWGAVTLVRQLVEPHIVSRSIGQHPLVTLVTLYVGFRLFGLVGMLVLPFLVMLLQNKYVYSNKDTRLGSS